MEGEGREIEKGGEGGGGRRSRKMGKGWLGGRVRGRKEERVGVDMTS